MEISSVVQVLYDALINEAGLLHGIKNEVEFLKRRLMTTQSFLIRHVNNKQLEDERVRGWLWEMREMAYEAEDVVETFIVNAGSSRSRGLFKSIITKRDKTWHQEINSIRARLNDTYKDCWNYVIMNRGQEADKDWRTREELLLPDRKKHEQVVGMEDKVKKLLRESILDVRDMNDNWDLLMFDVPNEQDQTSRFLLTTRSKDIVTYDRYTRCEMKLLDPEKSWELFAMTALIDESNGGCPKELEPIGIEIVKRCNGVPSTISVAGGLLVKTRSKSGWEQVLSLVSTHLGKPETSVFTILDSSYQNLFQQLKSCFLCLALFKEDAIIPAKTLQNIWVEQGLIEKDDERTVKEIARGYLDELINRNMLKIIDLNIEGRVKNCYLHGVVRAVCLRRANEELSLEMVDEAEVISSHKSSHRQCHRHRHRHRHRVVYGRSLKNLSLNGSEYLRSLFLLNNEGEGVDVDVDVSSVSHDFWKSCKLLRILHLDGIKLSTFPDPLGALIRLKCLRIRRHKIHSKYALEEEEDYLEAVKLPNWLDGLKHLEILDMEGEKVEFPKDVTLKMKRLRYFSAYCVRGPMSINSWENIETLKYIKQEDWIKCYSSQSSSCNVRKLGLFLDLLNMPGECSKVRASLEKMKKLEHLHLLWNPIIPIDPEIVPNLDTLTNLKLRGKLSRCPDASMFPPNLTHLTLELSNLREDLMAELSNLPALRYLKLLGNAYKAERMRVLHRGFPCLKALSLREMFLLKSIDIEEGGMPDLEHLRIQQCPSLQTNNNLPRKVVIEHIT